MHISQGIKNTVKIIFQNSLQVFMVPAVAEVISFLCCIHPNTIRKDARSRRHYMVIIGE